MAAPAFAASGNVALSNGTCSTVTHDGVTWARLTFWVTVTNLLVPTGTNFYFGGVDRSLFLPGFTGTTYGGTLISSGYLSHTSGSVSCLFPPCEETLRVVQAIPAGTYTLTVDVAVNSSPTTVRLRLPQLASETTGADNSVSRLVYQVNGLTSCTP